MLLCIEFGQKTHRLTVLYENGDKMPLNEIAKRIGRDKSTVTPLVNKLAGLGYVEKVAGQQDKRVTFVRLTERGYALKPRFDQISAQVYETAYRGFSPEEKEQFLSLLKRINQNFSLGIALEGDTPNPRLGADGTDGPTIDIAECYEGLEAAELNVLSGNISIISSDDCMNAANSDLGSYDFSMNISGGTINAYSSEGDGFGRGDRPSGDPPQKSTSKA